MVRTVKVRLELDRDDFKRGLRDVATEVRGFDGEVQAAGKDLGVMGVEVKSAGQEVKAAGQELDSASRSTRSFGDETRKAGAGLGKAKEQASGLGDQSQKTSEQIATLAQRIEDAKNKLHDLGVEFERTGAVSLFAQMAAQRNLITQLSRVKTELDGVQAATARAKDESARLAAEAESKVTPRMRDMAREIEQTKTAVQELSSAWVQTRDADVGGMLRDQLEHLRNLRIEYENLTTSGGSGGNRSLIGRLFDVTGIPSLFGRLSDLGLQAGDLFANGFMGALKGIFSAAWPALVPMIAGLLVNIGATAGGAVLGGVGLAGIAGALVAQLQDPRVKSAATRFVDDLKIDLLSVTSSFAGPLVAGFTALRREAAPFFDDLRSGFEKLAPYATMFMMRLGEALAKLGPGLSKALDAAGPALGALANALPGLMGSFAIFFQQVAAGGKGATEGLVTLVQAIGLIVSGAGYAIRAMSVMFDVFVQGADKVTGFLAKIPGLGALFDPLHTYVHSVAKSFDEAQISAGNFDGALDGVTTSANDTATAMQKAATASQNLFSTWQGLDQANIAVQQSFLALKDSVAQNGKTLSDHTNQGLANRQALLGVVDAAESVREKEIAMAQGTDHAASSTAAANQKYEDTIGKLYDAAKAAGLNRDQVDQMIGKYRQVPTDVSTRVTAQGVDTAIERVVALSSHLNALQDRTVTVTTVQNTITGEQRQVYKYGPKFERWGGLYEHAAVGALRDASIYSASGPARYAFAEPQTGGEAFIPRTGDMARSRAIWSYVGQNWLGVRPAGAGATTMTNIALTVNAGMGVDGKHVGQQIVEALRPIIRDRGGNVQMVLTGRSG